MCWFISPFKESAIQPSRLNRIDFFFSSSLFFFLSPSLQDVSNIPDLKCDGGEHGLAEDVLEPPFLSDHL